MNGLEKTYSKKQLEDLNALIETMDKDVKKQEEFANELLGIQISNAQKLYEKKKELMMKEQQAEIELANQINTAKTLAAMDISKRRAAIEKEYDDKMAKAKGDPKVEAKLKKKREKDLKNIDEENARLMKGIEDRTKKENKIAKEKEKREKTAAILQDETLSKQEKINKMQAELGMSEKEAKSTMKKAKAEEAGKAAYDALLSIVNELNGTINDIATAQTTIDTRLQGSKNATKYGSYWKRMSTDVVKYVGMSGVVKQADVVENLKTFVGKGISFNVEQRAFLETISDSIADTFNAADSTLLKLVRIQQEDTTAARLGMESALTSFLNSMYETTEYMSEMAESVRQNLYNATSLMTAKSATEFEYQVQKWMGSLYSVGFGTDLSSALGNLAAGNISSISDGGLGNLLVMAANNAGMSIADVLSKGLDASETNTLMQAMVNYLGQIYNETKGSNILAQQYAGVFGLTASDLKAAANLASSTKAISGNNLGYSGMLSKLSSMADTITQRVSVGGMLMNLMDNLKYATASTMANNPVLYTTYTLANILKDTTGGIDFSIPTVMGNGMAAQTFNVADIIRVATMSAGLLGGIGTMLTGLGGGGSSWGSGLLKAFGVGTSSNIVSRGTGGMIQTGGSTTSESGSYAGNSNGSDVQNKSMTETTDESQEKTVTAQEENKEATTTDINENVVAIYTLLQEVVSGASSLKVDMGNESAWGSIIRNNQIM